MALLRYFHLDLEVVSFLIFRKTRSRDTSKWNLKLCTQCTNEVYGDDAV